MNVYLLQHLAYSVRNLGPLWCQNALPYESMNGVCITQYVNGPCKPVHQIATKYTMSKYLSDSTDRKLQETSIIPILNYIFKPDENNVLQINDFDPTELQVFRRCRSGDFVYTSKIYKKVSYIDYFVLAKYNDEEFVGHIVLFSVPKNE